MKVENVRSKGFTLMELIIYTGILAVTSMLAVSILSSVSRIYTQNQSKIEVVQNLRAATQIIQEAIQQASAIDLASSSTLRLLMPDTATTTFTLSADTIYKQVGTEAQVAITSQKVKVNTINFSIVSTARALIDPINRWAWSGGASSATTAEGVGWIDFSSSGENVRVPAGAGDFYGYAYAPGPQTYIALNCATADYCTYPYKVSSDASGNLDGWAWSDIFGWISFNSSSTTSTIPYKVTISTSTGEFSGWAWSANESEGGIGWISFNCNNSGIGNTCAASNYKVAIQKKLGRPINAVQVDIAMEYNTANPLAQFSDAYSFAVVLAQPSAVTVASISPVSGASGSTVSNVTITGTNFRSGAAAKLVRPGYNDIFSLVAWTFNSSTTISTSGGTFDLSGAPSGTTWDVWVINPDGQIGVKPDGFTVN